MTKSLIKFTLVFFTIMKAKRHAKIWKKKLKSFPQGKVHKKKKNKFSKAASHRPKTSKQMPSEAATNLSPYQRIDLLGNIVEGGLPRCLATEAHRIHNFDAICLLQWWCTWSFCCTWQWYQSFRYVAICCHVNRRQESGFSFIFEFVESSCFSRFFPKSITDGCTCYPWN